MSRYRLPVPEQCRKAYNTYAADLDRSGLASRTRVDKARRVRRFLRWLPGHSGDATTALTQGRAWEHAVDRFTGEVAVAAGMAAAQRYQGALSDCARRLGLAEPETPIPSRFHWVHDSYTTALTQSPQSAVTKRSHLRTVRSFLRWLDQTGYSGDLVRDWGRAAEGYLQHLAAKGNAASSVQRHRGALTDCARWLRLPPDQTTAAHTGGATAADEDAPDLATGQGSTTYPPHGRFARTRDHSLGGKDNNAVDQTVRQQSAAEAVWLRFGGHSTAVPGYRPESEVRHQSRQLTRRRRDDRGAR